MTTVKILRGILADAIDAARAALRDLDDDEIPNRLRAVSRHGDGRLPVHLVKAVLIQIDDDEWFRSKVVEAFERVGDRDSIAEAFLRREPGWWITVGEAMTVAATGQEVRRGDRLEAELAEAQRRGEAERAKARQLAGDLANARTAARTEANARIGPLKASLGEARIEVGRAEERAVRAEAEASAARRERREEHAAASALAEELRVAKRKMAGLRRSADAGGTASVPRSPLEMARWLDRSTASLTPFREASCSDRGESVGDSVSTSRVPAGVAPDSSEAIDALLSDASTTVLVDGHNLLGVLDASTMATGRARRDLITKLEKLKRHLGDATVEVVFDSTLSDGRPVTVSDGGIVVRFAGPDVIADDVLVDRSAEFGTDAVVISDDRDVRERSAHHGATVLWARALAAWL